MTLVVPGIGNSTFVQSDGELTITIPVKIHGIVIPFMLVWLAGWAFGEFSAISEVLSGSSNFHKDGGVFLFVWLAVWSIAGPYALWTTVWMVFGRDLITIGTSYLKHRKEIFSVRFIRREYLLAEVSKIRTAPAASNKLRGRYQIALQDASSVAFDYGRSTIVLAPGMDEAEASYIVREMCKFSPQLRKSKDNT